MNKVQVDKKPVEIVNMNHNERDMLLKSNESPSDYVAVECCALGIQAIPQQAKVKSEDGENIKCVPFAIQIVVPLDASKVFKTSLYVSEEMRSNGAIQEAMPTPPIVRVLLKKDAVTKELLDKKFDETPDVDLVGQLLSSATQKHSER